MLLRRAEHSLEQCLVLGVVTLIDPKALEDVVSVLLGFGIKLFQPLVGGGQHLVAWVLGKFHPGAVTHAVDRVLEQVEQCLDRLAVHADFFGKLASLVGHAKDAAVGLIAVWVTNVVLHVADDDVLPVGDIERSVAADLEVGRSEVAVAGDEQILGLSAPDVALVIIFHRVLVSTF